MAEPSSLYGLLAEFKEPGQLAHAARAARAEGYTRLDAFTPFPVEEVFEALDLHRNRLPLLVLIGGLAGCIGGYFMQYYASVISYPINVGSRPLHSWPMFIPITFELTILAAALTAVLGMLALNSLPQPYHPLFNVPEFAMASHDRFFLCIQSIDPRFDLERTREFLSRFEPVSLKEVPL